MDGKSIKIKNYKVTKLVMNFDSLLNGEHNISLNMTVNTLTPKDKEDVERIAVIDVEFTEDTTSILSSTIRGYVDIETKNKEEIKRLMSEFALPELYNILRDYLRDVLKKSCIDFPDLPSVEEINF